MENTGNNEKPPEDCQHCSRWQAIKQKLRIAESLANTIEQIEKRLTSTEFKPTVGDYLKLLQVEKELEEESPKEIKVTWVGPEPKSESGE